VTASHVAPTGRDPFGAAYEELRRGVLVGASAGSHVGLALLLREGLAAWMARGVACAVPVVPVADLDRPVAAPIVSDEIHAGVVRVLATMALALGGLRELRA
jgi:hypothetical protein